MATAEPRAHGGVTPELVRAAWSLRGRQKEDAR
jgi:hypothetical protein